VSRGEFPPKLAPWFFDNGAFPDFLAGRPFQVDKWLAEVEEAAKHDVPPDFAVVPDEVGKGVQSLHLSVSWVGHVRELDLRPYLVVQDGMTHENVLGVLDLFDGLFVGGSTDWKMKTAAAWCDFAHDNGKPCHVGRVGTGHRVRWAREIGADSIDSSQPLWSRDHMRRFLRALQLEDNQGRLW
jgi:hypothetical protein